MILFPYHRFRVEVAQPPAELCQGIDLYLTGQIPPPTNEWISFEGWVDGHSFYLQRKLADYSYDPLGFAGQVVPGPTGSTVEITLTFRHMWLLILAPVPFMIIVYYGLGLSFAIAAAILFYGLATVTAMLRYWWVLALHKKDVIALLHTLKDKLEAYRRKLAKPGHQSLDY
jgi:hypothetical protein